MCGHVPCVGGALLDLGDTSEQPPPPAALADAKPKKKEKHKAASPAPEIKSEGDVNDLDFWLSAGDVVPKKVLYMYMYM